MSETNIAGTMSEIKQRIGAATTAAMKAREKARVAALRMVNAELKRIEVDERRELADEDVIAILNRMLKQRQDSLSQFESAGREDLAATERFEIALIREFMPEPLGESELEALIDAAIRSTGAASMRDMGKVMGELRPRIQGRADMAAVSAQIKSRLAG